MSEYCYTCQGCGRFSDDCICDQGFDDPMQQYREMDESELYFMLEDGF